MQGVFLWRIVDGYATMVIELLCLLHNFNGRSCLVSEIHRRINYMSNLGWYQVMTTAAKK